MAHAVRAIVLARATAASLRGRRSSNCNSHGEAVLLPASLGGSLPLHQARTVVVTARCPPC
jgi:hypothetical protein